MAPSSDSSVRKGSGWRLNQPFPMARPETVAVVLHLMIARERLPSHFLPRQLLSILPSKTVTHTIQVDPLSVFQNISESLEISAFKLFAIRER